LKASIRSASITMGAFDRGPAFFSPDFAGTGLGAAAEARCRSGALARALWFGR
jgi:hypothetical protein